MIKAEKKDIIEAVEQQRIEAANQNIKNLEVIKYMVNNNNKKYNNNIKKYKKRYKIKYKNYIINWLKYNPIYNKLKYFILKLKLFKKYIKFLNNRYIKKLKIKSYYKKLPLLDFIKMLRWIDKQIKKIKGRLKSFYFNFSKIKNFRFKPEFLELIENGKYLYLKPNTPNILILNYYLKIKIFLPIKYKNYVRNWVYLYNLKYLYKYKFKAFYKIRREYWNHMKFIKRYNTDINFYYYYNHQQYLKQLAKDKNKIINK